MKYVIYNERTQMYLMTNPVLAWGCDMVAATKYRQLQKANEALRKQKLLDWVGEDRKYIRPMPYKEGETEIKVEQAQQLLEKMDSNIQSLFDILENIPMLIAYLGKEQSKYELMQEDLLHKIEFDDVVGIDGLILAKKLKEVRIKRRKVKDQLQILNSLQTLNSTVESFNNRAYTPRVLTELFN